MVKNNIKVAFFVKKGMDDFLNDIIKGLSLNYKVRKIEVTNLFQINEGMEWADICWFEWCDDIIAYASDLELAKRKKIICRLHRYEIFTEYPFIVKWENIDKLVVVLDHVKKLLKEFLPDIEQRVSIETISNPVNLDLFSFQPREKGYNLAYIAKVRLIKNPMMILQIIKKLVEFDPRYKLFVAGKFYENLIELYWNHLIDEMNLKDHVYFEGWQKDINKWLENKDYIISTSVYESFGYNIAEGMAKGIKPVIHNFPTAKDIWSEKYLFNTIDEALEMIKSAEYNSTEYRDFVKRHYSLEKQIKKIDKMIKGLEKTSKKHVEDTLNEKKVDLILFGASTLGKVAFEILKRKYCIAYFCDNDKRKWGKKINNVEIKSPDYLKENYKRDKNEVIITSSYYGEISKQLTEMGINQFKVFQTTLQ
ncbi:MAG: hypothetical protein PWR10_645 [Halanaerobiales bacterium]|nr:hypothetical protein [Halanaerobiales bacterium]